MSLCDLTDEERRALADSETLRAARDARVVSCPWCGVPSDKDEACNWVRCGAVAGAVPRDAEGRGLYGCGEQFCFQCGLKLCNASESHGACCALEGYCPGGHNSHCERPRQ